MNHSSQTVCENVNYRYTWSYHDLSIFLKVVYTIRNGDRTVNCNLTLINFTMWSLACMAEIFPGLLRPRGDGGRRWTRTNMEDMSLSHPETTHFHWKLYSILLSKTTLPSISIIILFPHTIFHFCCGFSILNQVLQVACLCEATALVNNFLLVESRPLLQELCRGCITKHQTKILLNPQTRWNKSRQNSKHYGVALSSCNISQS